MPNASVQPEERAMRQAAVRDIYTYLDDRGIPDAWFARRMGVSRQAIRAYRRGDNRPPAGFITRAHELLGIPLDTQHISAHLVSSGPGRRKRATSATTGADPPAAQGSNE